jgi:hypothetical protein
MEGWQRLEALLHWAMVCEPDCTGIPVTAGGSRRGYQTGLPKNIGQFGRQLYCRLPGRASPINQSICKSV